MSSFHTSLVGQCVQIDQSSFFRTEPRGYRHIDFVIGIGARSVVGAVVGTIGQGRGVVRKRGDVR